MTDVKTDQEWLLQSIDGLIKKTKQNKKSNQRKNNILLRFSRKLPNEVFENKTPFVFNVSRLILLQSDRSGSFL